LGALLGLEVYHLDTIIFLDFPRWLYLYRAFKRVLQYRNQTRPDMGEGCPERMDWSFFKWIWSFPFETRPRIVELLHRMEGDKRVIRLCSPREVAGFLRDLQCAATAAP
jgi:adenylate kinase family enzyme